MNRPIFMYDTEVRERLSRLMGLTVLEGRLSPCVLGLVVEWAAGHREELLEDWNRSRRQEPLRKMSRWPNPMLKDIVEVRPLDGYRLNLRFEDGVEGAIDVSELVRFDGIFAPLSDRAFFQQVRVNPELGAIYWPNGADLDPDVLYSRISGAPLPSFQVKSSR